jgi:hypothetical protein
VESAEDVLPEWFKGKHIVGRNRRCVYPRPGNKGGCRQGGRIGKDQFGTKSQREVKEEHRQEQDDVSQS